MKNIVHNVWITTMYQHTLKRHGGHFAFSLILLSHEHLIRSDLQDCNLKNTCGKIQKHSSVITASSTSDLQL